MYCVNNCIVTELLGTLLMESSVL